MCISSQPALCNIVDKNLVLYFSWIKEHSLMIPDVLLHLIMHHDHKRKNK